MIFYLFFRRVIVSFYEFLRVWVFVSVIWMEVWFFFIIFYLFRLFLNFELRKRKVRFIWVRGYDFNMTFCY